MSTAMALDTYLNPRASKRYGWVATWPWDDRHTEDGEPNWEAVVAKAYGDAQNPYYPDAWRWATSGVGAHGHNPALHSEKWDPLAPPEYLCIPEVTTVVTVRIFRQAQRSYKAKTWTDINSVFAGRIENNRARHRKARDREKDQKFCDLAKKHGVDCNADATGKLGTKLGRHKTSDQDQFVEQLLGHALPR